MKKSFDITKYLPAGYDWENLRWGLSWGYFGSCLPLGIFLTRYWDARDALYSYTQNPDGTQVKTLVPGRIITPFWELMVQGPMLGVWCFIAVMALQVWRHYRWHTRDSMSIYTMRRLPDRWELHRRCWTVPVLASIAELLLLGVCLLLCWCLYTTATPAGHLPM